jgi:hypothetical protein
MNGIFDEFNDSFELYRIAQEMLPEYKSLHLTDVTKKIVLLKRFIRLATKAIQGMIKTERERMVDREVVKDRLSNSDDYIYDAYGELLDLD